MPVVQHGDLATRTSAPATPGLTNALIALSWPQLVASLLVDEKNYIKYEDSEKNRQIPAVVLTQGNQHTKDAAAGSDRANFDSQKLLGSS